MVGLELVDAVAAEAARVADLEARRCRASSRCNDRLQLCVSGFCASSGELTYVASGLKTAAPPTGATFG